MRLRAFGLVVGFHVEGQLSDGGAYELYPFTMLAARTNQATDIAAPIRFDPVGWSVRLRGGCGSSAC